MTRPSGRSGGPLPSTLRLTTPGRCCSWDWLGPRCCCCLLYTSTPSFLWEAEARFPAFLDQVLAEDPQKGEYFLPSVVTQLLEEKRARVKVLRSTDKWYGVTYREDKPQVVAAIAAMTQSGLYPERLWDI